MGMKVPIKFTSKSMATCLQFMHIVHFEEEEKAVQTISCQAAFFPRGSGPASFGFLQSGLKNNDIIIQIVIDLGDDWLKEHYHL